MERGIIGPVLPDDFPVGTSDDKNEETSKSDLYGPQLPQHLLNSQRVNEEEEEDDDEDSKNIIGPLPAHLASSSSSFQALNERAELLRFKNSMRVGFSIFQFVDEYYFSILLMMCFIIF